MDDELNKIEALLKKCYYLLKLSVIDIDIEKITCTCPAIVYPLNQIIILQAFGKSIIVESKLWQECFNVF